MKKKKRTNRAGFTIVELLVVFSITAALFAGLAFYNRAMERQIILFKEQMKIVSALQRAKSLSLAAFGESNPPCGYGVHFEMPRKIVIFKELIISGSNCLGGIDFVYSGDNSGEKVEELALDGVVEFPSGQLGLNDVVFYPPDPIIIIDKLIDKYEALIALRIVNSSSEKRVKITTAGQITAL